MTPLHMEESVHGGRRLNAVWPLLMVIVCVTIAEILLKMGANATSGSEVDSAVSSGVSALGSGFTIIGIVFHLAGFAAWMYALKWVPLSLAFNFISIQQVTVTLGAWWFLHEMISPIRWLGIGLAVIGVMLLVPAIVDAEKKTEGGA